MRVSAVRMPPTRTPRRAAGRPALAAAAAALLPSTLPALDPCVCWLRVDVDDILSNTDQSS